MGGVSCVAGTRIPVVIVYSGRHRRGFAAG